MSIGVLTVAPFEYDFNRLSTDILDKSNFKSAVKSWTSSDYHTSIEDLALKTDNVKELLDNIKEINFINITDIYHNSPVVLISMIYLLLTRYKSKLSNSQKELYDIFVKYQFRDEYFTSQPTPKSNKKKLWIAGCSMSAGNDVPAQFWNPGDPFVEDEERWGYIVSQHLDREEMNVARRGCSVFTSLQQILRANINPENDILVWQITSFSRVNLIDSQGYFRPVSTSQEQKYVLDTTSLAYMGDMHHELLSLSYVKMGIEYCRQRNIKLFIVNMLGNSKLIDPIIKCRHLTNSYIDYGYDKSHPGPKQNAEYAKEIIKLIQGE